MQTCDYCGLTSNRDSADLCAECGCPLPAWREANQLSPGDMLHDRYEVVEVLGAGGMSTVYLVKDRQFMDRLWAMKEMLFYENEEHKTEALNQFKLETRILVNLNHPNLPQIVNTFSEGEREYLIMEYIQGETLETLIDQSPQGLPQDEVLQWADQLCGVLGYLHEQKPPVIFRDMKPGNIMVTRQGHIKLIDFGIARLFNPSESRDTRQLGTSGYAPPEQYGQGQTDVRSDIYALGATLHHLLSGRDPGEQPFSFPPLSSVPAHVNRAVSKAVAFEPDERYQDVEAFRQDLLSHARRPPVAGWRNRQPLFFWSSLIIIAVVVALLLFPAAGFDIGAWFAAVTAPLQDSSAVETAPDDSDNQTVETPRTEIIVPEEEPTWEATATPPPTPTVTNTPRPTATKAEESPLITVEQTATPTATQTATPSPTPTNTRITVQPTATPEATNTPLPPPTDTPPPPPPP